MVGFPGLRTARAARQLLRGRNAFEELVAGGGGAAAGPQALDPREASSPTLWLLACLQARRRAAEALARPGGAAAAEARLAHLGELQRLGQRLLALGILRPTWLQALCQRRVDRWFSDCVRSGVESGVVRPGVTQGIPAQRLVQVSGEPDLEDLIRKEHTQRHRLYVAVQRGFIGKGHLSLSDDDLVGVPDEIRRVWQSSLGSAAFWRASKYRVPINRDAMVRVMPLCQNAETRSRLFEAYFAGFGGAVGGAALALLRARRELAQRLGYPSWAAYELHPLALGDEAGARALLERCWQELQPGLAPVLRRMAQLAGAGRGPPAHADEAFLRALAAREADERRLAEFLPAQATLPRLLGVLGRLFGVAFRELEAAAGWRAGVRAFEVLDAPGAGAGAGRGRLGFVYVSLERRRGPLGGGGRQPAGAVLLCRGQVYLGVDLQAASWRATKLLNPEEAATVAHELGHAVHMLCQGGSPQEFDDLPLDVVELPSVLAETVAMHPAVLPHFARHHASGGPPPDALAAACRHGAYFFVRYLRSMHVSLGLHGQAFDPHAATPEGLREAAVALWQRYSPVAAHPGFTPLGEDAGVYLALGAAHPAYLHCHVRADALLHARLRAAGAPRAKDAAQRWLGPEFAGQLRAQLLDQRFPAQRRAALVPLLAGRGGERPVAGAGEPSASAAAPRAHPLPAPPPSAAAMFGRLQAAGHEAGR